MICTHWEFLSVFLVRMHVLKKPQLVLCYVPSVQHTMHSDYFFPHSKALICRFLHRNENESAACVKGQRVCLCSLVKEMKEPLLPHIQLLLLSGAA